jgi:hypothetical protein
METTNLLAKTSTRLKTELATQNKTSIDAKNFGSFSTNDVYTTENTVPMKTTSLLDLTSTCLKTELATQNYPSTDEQNLGSFVTSSASITDRPSNIVALETTNLLVLTSKSLKTEFTDHDDIRLLNIQETMKPVNDLESFNSDELLRTTKSEISFYKSAISEETLNNPKPSFNELETSIISTTEFIQSLYKKSRTFTSSEDIPQQQENQERGKNYTLKCKKIVS